MSILLMRPPEEILADIEADVRNKSIYDALKEKTAYWTEHFSDDPSNVSGWGHHYVCPGCGGSLKFDRASPQNHLCPACGTSHNSEDMQNAWYEARRNDIADSLGAAAVLYRCENDAAYKRLIVRVIKWYADHYAEFEEHGKWVGSAKVMGHTLGEAIWGIRLVEALMLAGVCPDGADALYFKRNLFVPLLRLINSQPTNLMNISLWHAAYTMAVGAYYNDAWLMRPYAGYERNGARLITDNITEDGLWKENSVSYHYYALSAAFYYLVFLKRAAFDDENGDRLRAAFTGGGAVERIMLKAYTAPLKLLFLNGDMPATSDGWKYSLDNIRDAYIAACKLFKGCPDDALLSAAVHAAGVCEPTQNSLLFGLPERSDYPLFEQESVHLAHNRIIILRSGQINAVLKYGNLCAGHSHPDALSLMIYPFSVDPGSMAYGLPIHGEYFYVNGSHSTFMVDGINQHNAASGTGTMDDGGGGAEAAVSDAYPGVTARRRVRIKDNVLTDEMTVTCGSERIIDWIFHGCGAFYFDAESENAAGALFDGLPEYPPRENGYKHFVNVRRADCGNMFNGHWIYKGLRLDIALAVNGADIFIADTPDNPITETRRAVVARVRARETTIKAVFSIGDA